MSDEPQTRIIRDGTKYIHQFSYDGETWYDLAHVTGESKPAFHYGKPWADHVHP